MATLTNADCLVIIPAYNAERDISELIQAIRAFGFTVLVIDDGSKDATAAKAEKAGATVLISKVNQGKGAALRRGFDWFLKQNYSAAIIMDSDGQHDPKELRLFIDALGQNDGQVFIGNRLDDSKNMPWIRKATNRFMSWIVSSVAKQSIPDSQCGYRAIKREVLEKISLTTCRFEIDSEILFETARAGFKIISVPIRCVYRNEKSHINPFRDTIRFFRFLFGYISQPVSKTG